MAYQSQAPSLQCRTCRYHYRYHRYQRRDYDCTLTVQEICLAWDRATQIVQSVEQVSR
jgi:hypothetical protein